MENEMLCSVIVPAYNCEHTLCESVESALAQTYSNLEILIVDDCSSDNTALVMQELAARDKRVRCISLSQNGGVAEARNKAFAEAKGLYCAFLDSDDLWAPQKIETQIALLEKGLGDFSYSSYSFINGEGTEIGKAKLVPDSCTLSDLLKENFILCSSVVMKTEICKFYAMDGTFSHEDFVYWLTLLREGFKAIGYTSPLVKYRVYEKNRSGNKVKAAHDRWIVYRQFLNLDIARSCGYFLSYTFHGLLKYSRLKK
ncbi:glycosyl transferase [Sphaerochaeta pleomorpha str. Grapes]|uniref:Glycosyl transferase n=1 Tax=Sphaerochaeta pleomorpha (strain ATCC BAA-1885 / DSM 22778 / Grapes) TaxID=158190 RepID=G8QS46_SPHPG|nr:glycosyltransferase family 2 protein [Sphaerochaeta pleomorpha]AEV28907.1 glycosyl transferase [Sphaerochaeta pleomorpha str. Grapes]